MCGLSLWITLSDANLINIHKVVDHQGTVSSHNVSNLSTYYWILAISPPSTQQTKSTWLLFLIFQLLGSPIYFKVSIPFQGYWENYGAGLCVPSLEAWICLWLKCTKLEVTRFQRLRRKRSSVTVSRVVTTEVEDLALGTQLVLRLNYSQKLLEVVVLMWLRSMGVDKSRIFPFFREGTSRSWNLQITWQTLYGHFDMSTTLGRSR